MPELPEVETIRRQLAREITSATIKNVEVRSAKPLNVSKEKFISAVRGARIEKIERRAKLLIFGLSNGNAILFHLKMTGRMLLVRKNEPLTKHTHLVFELSGGDPSTSLGAAKLFFEDYRRFGFVKLMKAEDLERYLAGQDYGPEPIGKNFSYTVMRACFLAHKNKKIKQMLMEQSCVAGIGNIYAAEICFFAGVRPGRKIADIKEAEFKKIYQGAKKILADAMSNRGTSADAYVDAYGKKGTFVSKLKVYGREGKKCLSRRSPNGAKGGVRCGGIIIKEKLGGRGTYWCPKCQK